MKIIINKIINCSTLLKQHNYWKAQFCSNLMLSTINFCEGATAHFGLGLDTHLFVKVPRPGDSERDLFGL